MRKLACLLLLTASCATGSAHYSESDSGKTISADLGTDFYVSVSGTVPVKDVPKFSPSVLELAGDTVEEATKVRTLKFTARGLGETDLLIGGRFRLHIAVTSSSDRPGMHIHQH